MNAHQARRAMNGSRLWPVLTVLVGLISSALALEVHARTRDPQAIVVAIRSQALGELAGDESSDDEGGEVEADSSAPLHPAHAAARELGRRGDVAGAVAALRKLIESEPQQALLHADLGYFALLEGRPVDALGALQRARELGAASAQVSLNLGVALCRLNRLDEAERALDQALAQKPGFRAARLALSTVLRLARRYPEAIAILTELAKSGGNAARARALLSLGRTQLAAGHDVAADKAFEHAIEWMPAAAELRISIARAYLAASGAARLAKARLVAETAVEVAPDLAEAHGALARVKELSGDVEGAQQGYEVALRLRPEYHHVRRRALRLALESRDYAMARAQAERLLAQAPENPEHHFLAGLVAARADAPDDARAHYRAAIEAAQDRYPEAYFNLGALEKDQRHLPEAIAAYERAIASKPDYLAAYNNLGIAHVAAGDTAKAEAAYRKALELDVSYWPAWTNLGKLELHRKRFPEAIGAFERAVAVRPKAHEALLNLGVAYRKAGRLPDAIATYRKLIEAQPRYATAWYDLGIALERSEQRKDARAAYERAIEIDEEHEPALRRLAALLAAQGDIVGARARYQAVIDRDPADSRAWIALAELERRQGNVARCTHALHSAVASDSGTAPAAEIETLLGRCKRAGGAELQL